MQYISSDTNVWLDFAIIERLELPFRLPCIYLMHGDAVHDELLSPPGLGEHLMKLGLEETELSEEEFLRRADCVIHNLNLQDTLAQAEAFLRSMNPYGGTADEASH